MSVYPPGRPKRYDPIHKKGTLPPHAPGEYRILGGKREKILYIGETCDLLRRMQEHIRTGKIHEYLRQPWRHICWFEFKVADPSADPQARRAHEKQKIRQHSPALNRSKGGEGRMAKSG